MVRPTRTHSPRKLTFWGVHAHLFHVCRVAEVWIWIWYCTRAHHGEARRSHYLPVLDQPNPDIAFNDVKPKQGKKKRLLHRDFLLLPLVSTRTAGHEGVPTAEQTREEEEDWDFIRITLTVGPPISRWHDVSYQNDQTTEGAILAEEVVKTGLYQPESWQHCVLYG